MIHIGITHWYQPTRAIFVSLDGAFDKPHAGPTNRRVAPKRPASRPRLVWFGKAAGGAPCALLRWRQLPGAAAGAGQPEARSSPLPFSGPSAETLGGGGGEGRNGSLVFSFWFSKQNRTAR